MTERLGGGETGAHPEPGAGSSGSLTDSPQNYVALRSEFDRAVLSWKANEDLDAEIIANLTAERDQLQRERDELRKALEIPLQYDVLVSEWKDRTEAAEAARDRLTEALNALDLSAGYYRRELKEILAHCEDGGQALAISKIRAHAQDAIRAADASLAAAGSGGNTEDTT